MASRERLAPLSYHLALLSGGKGVSTVTSVADLSRIKLAMLHRLDTTLRQNYHQTLLEVLNELRMRSVVSQPDPTPDKVFKVILQTHVLSYKPTPSVAQMREALERLEHGKYGLCVRCGREIEAEILLHDPTLSCCPQCQSIANG
jgi:RNA polymerase-binding transcription factor DksA